MSWESLDTYQQLVEMHPDLNEKAQHEAFTKFLNRMWTKPTTYGEFARAYMEFTTSDNLTFPKLNALSTAKKANTRRKRSKRSRRRRSRRKRKPKKA
jgi:hypothetical protein